MWYAVGCTPSETEKTQHFLNHTFIFTYERMRRYEGSWHLEIKEMFPGYMFVEAEDPKEVESVRPHGQKKDLFLKLSDEEETLLKKLCGEEHHLKMSRGYILNGMTYIEEGPLKGMEKWIRKIDRHKRLASIANPDGSIGKVIPAGLEIVYKR